MAGERLERALVKFRERYAGAKGRKERGRILDEFCQISSYHRKYAIFLLQPRREATRGTVRRRRGFSYSAAALEEQLLAMSPRQLDRRLKHKKQKLKRRIYGRCKPATLLKHLVPVRAGAGRVNQPGLAEMDLVER